MWFNHKIAQWLLQAKSPNSWLVYLEVLTLRGLLSASATSAHDGVLILSIAQYWPQRFFLFFKYASEFQVEKEISLPRYVLCVLWGEKK